MLASPSWQYQAVLNNFVSSITSNAATLVVSGAMYQSSPAVGSQVVVFAPRSNSATAQVVVTNSGSSTTLTVTPNALLPGSWISLSGFPFVLGTGASSNITIKCTTPSSPTTPQWNETISLMTNDPARVVVHYAIVCDSVGPVYSSSPSPGASLNFGVVANSSSIGLTISNLGLELLTSQSSTLSSSWFSLSTPGTVSVVPGQSSTIAITCQPPVAAIPPYSQTTTLSYSTNEAPGSMSPYSYSLTCSKPAPNMLVSPASGSTISFSRVTLALNHTVSISNYGSAPLSVSQSASLASGSWFSISSGSLPIMSLNQGSPASIISIMCTPPTGSSSSMPFVDTLVLSSNDPAQLNVMFTLSCTAAPSMTLTPSASSTISFGSVSSSSTKTISISNNGAGSLSVSQSASFASGSWFSISSGSLPIMSLNQGSGSSIITLVCTVPLAAQGPFVDTLVLSSNDPSHSSVIFTLNCTPYFSSNPAPGSLVSIQAPAYIPSNGAVTVTNFDHSLPLPIAAFLSAPSSATLSSGVFALSPSGQSNITAGGSLSLTVSCTPFNDTAQYQATLVVMTGSPPMMNFSYSIVCNAQPLVSFNFGALSLGPLNGGQSTNHQLSLSNQASMTVSLSLSGIIDGMSTNVSRRRSSLETLDSSWMLYSDVATVSLTPSSVTLAPAGSGEPTQVLLSLIPLRPFAHTLVLQLMTPFTRSPVSVAQFDWLGIAPLIEFESNNSSSFIDVGSVAVGASKIEGGLLSNIGNAVLDLSGLSIDSSSSAWLSVVSSLPHQLLPGELLTITVECMPASTGAFSTTLTLSSSSPLYPELPISVTCVGTASCNDGYRNQGEVDIDCGGPCEPCIVPPPLPVDTPADSSSPPPTTPGTPEPPRVAHTNNTNNGTTQELPPPLDEPLVLLDTSITWTIATPVVQPLATNGSSTTVTVTSPSGRSASVTLSSGGDTGEATALVVAPVSASVLNSAARLSNVRLGSLAIDVTLANGTSQLSSPAQVCFSINQGTSYHSACLGYIDSSGRWQCEDKCPSMSNSTKICGSTSHFTNFAVLLSGGGGRQCNPYITGSWRGDLGLAASVAGFLILVCCVILVVGCSPPGRKLLAGPEGRRIMELQHQSASWATDQEAGGLD